MPTDAERREAEREALKQKALREMFPELSKEELVKKERGLRLMIRDQLMLIRNQLKLPPTNVNSMEELHRAQDKRWYNWVSTERTGAEIWIGMEVHWYQVREEIRAMEARARN